MGVASGPGHCAQMNDAGSYPPLIAIDLSQLNTFSIEPVGLGIVSLVKSVESQIIEGERLSPPVSQLGQDIQTQ